MIHIRKNAMDGIHGQMNNTFKQYYYEKVNKSN